MVWPAPSILVIIHIMTQLCQTDDVLKIIPGDTANRILCYHTGYNDSKPRVHHILGCSRSGWIICVIGYGWPRGKLYYNPASANSRPRTRSAAKYSRAIARAAWL